MKNKILFNDLKINFLITFLTAVLGFFTNKYFAKYMGISYLGLMKLFTQLITYLSLVELGVGTASAYALYKPLGENDTKQVNIVISTIDSFYKKIAIFILVVGIFFNIFLKYFIKDIDTSYAIYVYWTLYVVNVSIGYCYAKYIVLFTANQEYGFVRKIQGITKGVFQLLQIVSLVLTKSFYVFIGLLIMENIVNFYFYRKYFNERYYYLQKVKEREKKIIKDMKNIFWHKLGWVIVHNTDYIILSKFVSLSIVGIYSSYLIVYQMLIMIVDILTNVLNPKIGDFIAKNSKEKIYEYWKELYYVYLCIGIIFTISTYKLITPFIKLWLGEEYVLSQFTVILILIKLFIHITRIITISFKDLSGFYRDTYSPILESVINLILSLFLVKKYQLNGVLIGTIIANIIVMVFLKPILIFKECFNKNTIDYLKTLGYSLVILMVLLFFIDKNFTYLKLGSIENWKDFLLHTILIGGLVSLNSVFLFYFMSSEFKKLTKSIFKFVFK